MAAPAAPPPTGNRKTFRRTKVSAVERVASLIIVGLLVRHRRGHLVEGQTL